MSMLVDCSSRHTVSDSRPMMLMHKAERKYEVGKVTDAEEAKQRRLRSILNKLTFHNLVKMVYQVKQVSIDNADTLSGLVGQIVDRALMETTFVEVYASFCSRLAAQMPDFGEANEKVTVKRLLLNKCQHEFEREDKAIRTEEEREEARKRKLGNIRLICELYNERMFPEKVMHVCIRKFLGFNQSDLDPDEEDIEVLCKLVSTIRDRPRAKGCMITYFDKIFQLSNNMSLSSRVRFMLKDTLDLRKNMWQQRRKVEEVHPDAVQECLAQSSRLARGVWI